MKEIVCDICGSNKVSICTWIDLNDKDNITIRDLTTALVQYDSKLITDVWCDNCKKHVELKVIYYEKYK